MFVRPRGNPPAVGRCGPPRGGARIHGFNASPAIVPGPPELDVDDARRISARRDIPALSQFAAVLSPMLAPNPRGGRFVPMTVITRDLLHGKVLAEEFQTTRLGAGHLP